MLHDLHNELEVRRGFDPVVVTDNTAQVSAIIDMQNCSALEFVIQTGTLEDSNATFAVLVEHDDASGFGTAEAVADADLLGTEAGAAFTFAEDQKVRKIGYKGAKRYVRLTCTPSGNTGNAPLACVAIVKNKKLPAPSNE